MADSREIIILSDDDEDRVCDEDRSCLIVEEEEVVKTPGPLLPTASSQDEDLVVTFCRRAEILPHARYDCPVHPFTAAECEASAPLASNQLFCDQCFCYVCDKLASSCLMWCRGGVCHCNSHKKSVFWTSRRNSSLLGRLKSFNLTLSEVDSSLRLAETLLQSFREELSTLFSSFMKGRTVQGNSLNQPGVIHDYTPVYQFVSLFLDQADRASPKAAAIMNLGAAEDFIRHYYVNGMSILQTYFANPVEAKILLMQRVIATVQRLMVKDGFTSEFICKLQNFYKGLSFPTEVKDLKNSLCVRPWDDILLVSVLNGQNVSGVRTDKGKKCVLIEPISVVLLRTDVLQQQHKYRNLCRYLRVVKTDDLERVQQVKDLIPFFMCMEGALDQAVKSMLPPINAPAFRLTPNLFLVYLRIFRTATVPKVTVTQPAHLHFPEAAWLPIKGAVPLKRAELVKFALMVHNICLPVYVDSQCWVSLLSIVNTSSGSPGPLPPPSQQFLHEARDVVSSILTNENGSNILIPRHFLEVYPDQALLLLATGALSLRILYGSLSPALPVLNTLKENEWASRWLYDSLSSDMERLRSFAQEVTHEMDKHTGGPLAVKVNSSQVQTSSQSRLVMGPLLPEHLWMS